MSDSKLKDDIIDFDDTDVASLLRRAAEDDTGHLEYKYKLTDLTKGQFERLTTQMKYRINSDKEYGQAIYDIGLTDDGFAIGLTEPEMKESLKNLNIIATRAGAKICNIIREEVKHYAESEDKLLEKYLVSRRFTGMDAEPDLDSAAAKRKEQNKIAKDGETEFIRHVSEVLIRKHDSESKHLELRIGVAGNVDCGKSSTIGVLTKGVLDNGDGSARNAVANFKHEIDTGRTSSIAQQIMGFDDKGQSVNDTIKIRKPTWEDIVKASTKVITFFDLAGHKKYLRTTISGMTSNRPDYAMIMVGANMGITEITLEHINLCLTLKVPFTILLTKIDLVKHAQNVLKETLDSVLKLVNKKARKMPYKIRNRDDVMNSAKKIQHGDIVPIFFLSNVTGEGLDLFKLFLNYLPIRRSYRKAINNPMKMQVQEIFTITGTGTVAAGLLTNGSVKVGDTVKLGPNAVGNFIDTRVRSIQCKRVPVTSVTAGKYVCLGLHNVPRREIKKGMFILNSDSKAKAIWEFWATVYINTSDSANIKVGYQPYCHIGHIRQTCKILELRDITVGKKTAKEMRNKGIEEVKSIGAGDTAKVKLRFCFRPELIFDEDKTRFIFRESMTRGIGMITETTDTEYEPLSNKAVTKSLKSRPSRRERRANRLAKLASREVTTK